MDKLLKELMKVNIQKYLPEVIFINKITKNMIVVNSRSRYFH